MVRHITSVKATFTLDGETVNELSDMAERLRRPKSQIVREAIHEYGKHADKLSPEERDRMLRAIDEVMAKPPTRPQGEVDAEIADIRESRRLAGEHRSKRLGY